MAFQINGPLSYTRFITRLYVTYCQKRRQTGLFSNERRQNSIHDFRIRPCKASRTGKKYLLYAGVVGMVKVVLFDDRKSSTTYKQVEEYYIGESNYSLLHIPHGVTNGMQGLGTSMSIVANCATLPHDPSEMIRIDPATADIPYKWTVRPR